MSGKALFLDRDGTLIIDGHHVHVPDEVELLPGASEAVAKALELGYKLFLFTNQSGIGRGLFQMEDAIACNDRLIELLGCGPDVFAEICIAPEHPDDPPIYRKPEPRFILESIEKFQLDPAQCYMVGDRTSDWLAGINAGITSVAVDTGKDIDKAQKAFIESNGVLHYPNFLRFVESLG